jgi:hypothetical protein
MGIKTAPGIQGNLLYPESTRSRTGGIHFAANIAPQARTNGGRQECSVGFVSRQPQSGETKKKARSLKTQMTGKVGIARTMMCSGQADSTNANTRKLFFASKQPAHDLKMKKLSTFCVTGLLTLALGCSTFRSSHQTLTVQVTDPPQSKVWVNRVYEGEAPVQVSVLRNKSVDVMVKKEGFQTVNRTVNYHLNTTGVLDIIGAWVLIVPFIGIMAPGHDSLDETSITLQLTPGTDAVVETSEPQPASNNNNNTGQEKNTNTDPF